MSSAIDLQLRCLGRTTAIVGALVLASCSSSLKWTEDVRLPDGRVVTLTRYQEFKGPHEIGGAPTESDYWFEFRHPGSGETVRWSSDRDLAPLVLMLSGPTPFLLTTPHFGSSMFRYECPDPPYLLFRYESGTWRQAPLSQMPATRVRVNLTFAPKQQRQTIERSGHHLKTEQTQESVRNSYPYILNFGGGQEQTFRTENCDRAGNDLIER